MNNDSLYYKIQGQWGKGVGGGKGHLESRIESKSKENQDNESKLESVCLGMMRIKIK